LDFVTLQVLPLGGKSDCGAGCPAQEDEVEPGCHTRAKMDGAASRPQVEA